MRANASKMGSNAPGPGRPTRALVPRLPGVTLNEEPLSALARPLGPGVALTACAAGMNAAPELGSAATARVTGTVACRERIALPPNAVIARSAPTHVEMVLEAVGGPAPR